MLSSLWWCVQAGWGLRWHGSPRITQFMWLQVWLFQSTWLMFGRSCWSCSLVLGTCLNSTTISITTSFTQLLHDLWMYVNFIMDGCFSVDIDGWTSSRINELWYKTTCCGLLQVTAHKKNVDNGTVICQYVRCSGDATEDSFASSEDSPSSLGRPAPLIHILDRKSATRPTSCAYARCHMTLAEISDSVVSSYQSGSGDENNLAGVKEQN
jgi:hypothetical protein